MYLQVFKKKSPIWTILGIFNELLSAQNVNASLAMLNATFWVILKHCEVVFRLAEAADFCLISTIEFENDMVCLTLVTKILAKKKKMRFLLD